MWSVFTKAFSPVKPPTNILNPLITLPHFPPFERKGADGQFEIVHAPSHHPTSPSLQLPSGIIVSESTSKTPRNDLLHDILISIPPSHWTKLVDHNNQHCALQTVLHLVRNHNIRDIHHSLTSIYHEPPGTDRTHIYASLGLHIDITETERHPTPPFKLCASISHGNASATTSLPRTKSHTRPSSVLTHLLSGSLTTSIHPPNYTNQTTSTTSVQK